MCFGGDYLLEISSGAWNFKELALSKIRHWAPCLIQKWDGLIIVKLQNSVGRTY